MRKISWGTGSPSTSFSAFFTTSPLRTNRFVPFGTAYSTGAVPSSGIMRIKILDLASSSSIVPSISASNAGLDGRRTSNNSLTRGRPPVISPVRLVWTGIRARISPAATVSPFDTFNTEYIGNRYSAIFLPPSEITSPRSFTNVIAGFNAFLVFAFQFMTLRETIPVMESTSSWYETFSTKSWN